jgi:hypothetical protein
MTIAANAWSLNSRAPFPAIAIYRRQRIEPGWMPQTLTPRAATSLSAISAELPARNRD